MLLKRWRSKATGISDICAQVNRPLGSTDISANLKNKVSKAIAQKALVTLAEKGKLTRKDYGSSQMLHAPSSALGPDVARSILRALRQTDCLRLPSGLRGLSLVALCAPLSVVIS